MEPTRPAKLTLRPEQAGFRPGRGCIEHILALRRVNEICDQYAGFYVVSVFIDFTKAFDSLDRVYMAHALHSTALRSAASRRTSSELR
jgi:hypothetical protein